MISRDQFAPRAVAVTGFAYLALAAAAIELTRLSGGIALMWVANGALLAALGFSPRRRWPALCAAAFTACFVATLILRHSWIAAFGFSSANIAETLIAVWLMGRWGARRRMLDDVRTVMLFALAAGVVAPGFAAPFGAIAAHYAFGLPFAHTATDWWIGHGLGMLITAPLAVLTVTGDLSSKTSGLRWRDAKLFVGLIGLVLATTVAVFAQDDLPLLFVPALPVLVATFRLGRIGAAAALLVVAAVGGALTIAGHGPVHLVHGTGAFQLQFFQFYIGTLFLIALPTAATLTHQRKLTARLRESEAALRLLADNSSDVLLNLDMEGRIRFASPSVRALGGYEPDALIGRNALELIDPPHRALVQRAHLDALSAPETNVTVEYQARREDGAIAWFETNTRAVRGDDGEIAGVVSAIRDVSHRKLVERQLQLAADTDALTGLANRRPFMAALEAAIAAADTRPSAMVLIDLDHFKQVNDRYGHPAGDAALVAVAEVCLREVRGDDVVARLGGEEFAILLRGADLNVAKATCERLRLAIAAQPILAPSTPMFRVTASFGLALVTSGAAGNALIAAADGALYAAKHAGRNRLSIAA